jgi:hypothetical protein
MNMKKTFLLTALTTLLGIVTLPALAQPGPQGPRFDGAMAKMFGTHKTFSADLEVHAKGRNNDDIAMPGTFCFDSGKSRFEMDMSKAKGAALPPEALEQMKSMGMDRMIAISRPDKKLHYLIYPGLNCYAEVTPPNNGAGLSPDDFTLATTELGKETVDGHPCVKNKVVATNKDGAKSESTVWNATDLDKFPVKIESTESGRKSVMLFKNISFKKPAASQFEAPAGLTKYTDAQTMMQTEIMKKMGGGMPKPPQR